ncbi:MAG: alpha/beta hydrolase [Bdellovibrionaceae bacterium]|nr:alpha/beta hydrolase [Pseudobdellovibrionaceae bacterium]
MATSLAIFVFIVSFSLSLLATEDSIDQFRQCVNCTVDDLDRFFNQTDTPYESFRLLHSENSKGPVLLVHGLSHSPYYMKDLANMYYQQGYDVYVPLLKGHGNAYEALETIHHSEWHSQIESIFEQLSQRYSDKISLGGFSNGALLSTVSTLSEYSRDKISSLLLISPAFKLPLSVRLKLKTVVGFEKLVAVAKWSVLKSSFEKLRRLKVVSGMSEGTRGPVRYNDTPLNGVLQVNKGAALMAERSKNRAIRIPTVMVLSSGDTLISNRYAVDTFNKLFAGEKHLIWLQSPGDQVEKTPRNVSPQNLSVITVDSLVEHTITLNRNSLARPSEGNPVYQEMEKRISEKILNSGVKSCLLFYSK